MELSGSRRTAHSEEQLLEARRLDAISRFAAGIAHEFNAALADVRAHANSAANELPSEHPAHAELDAIRTRVDRAATLARHLMVLDPFRPVGPRGVRVNDVVSSLPAVLGGILGEEVELSLSLDPDVGSVHADPLQLEILVLLLTANARAAMAPGGRLSIETATSVAAAGDELESSDAVSLPAGRYALLVVRDTRLSFAERDLAVTRSFVDAIGGAIWVERNAGGDGISTSVYLPYDEAGGEDATPRHTEAEAAGPAATILFVETDGAVRRVVCKVLRRTGYAVLDAPDAATALDIASRHGGTIELLLTDIDIPGMAASELADRLSSLQPGLRVLFTSGYPEHEAAHGLAAAGEGGFLAKPFTASMLIRKVREALAR